MGRDRANSIFSSLATDPIQITISDEQTVSGSLCALWRQESSRGVPEKLMVCQKFCKPLRHTNILVLIIMMEMSRRCEKVGTL